MVASVSQRVALVDKLGLITREWFRLIDELITDANGGGLFTLAIDGQADLSKRNWALELTANATIANPANAKVGQTGFIRITQNDAVAKTLAFGSFWQFASGTPPTVSTGLSAIDVLVYHVIATDAAACTYIKGVS
jgi:hypothetical protein